MIRVSRFVLALAAAGLCVSTAPVSAALAQSAPPGARPGAPPEPPHHEPMSQAELDAVNARPTQLSAIPPGEATWRTVAPENLLVIDTSKGRVIAELEPRAAPNHVARIRELADRGFYDGLKFHRVIPGFMAQTGDPQGTGEGGSDLPDVAGEFTFRRGRDAGFAPIPNTGTALRGLVGSLPVETQPDAQMMITADMKVAAMPLFCPGVLGMARAGSPDSANSQFFLMTGTNASLNGGYTAFGRVLSGLDVLRLLKSGTNANNGAVTDSDIIVRARTADAIPAAERPSARVMDARSPAILARAELIRASRGLAFSICDIEPAVQITTGG